ncbi:TadE/TadG family type IV pilus assembly protein [Halomonas salinarum]|uniref:TadE/TadG family type IV pilus assembly protein n=1 Tax=Halomonas salinarum TaxID=1158993 RepID=UPI00143C56B1|nr:TadE/TadG family type IV pilus assembly protein [Halomonas salinarum]
MKPGRSLHRQKGSELVEFAISATLLFLLLFGIIEFSVALFDKATLTNATREGAREGILFRTGDRALADMPTTEDVLITQAIEGYADSYLISLGGPAELAVDIQRNDRNGNGNFDAGDDLTVSVDYPYQFLVLPGFMVGLGDVLTLSSTTVMRAE